MKRKLSFFKFARYFIIGIFLAFWVSFTTAGKTFAADEITITIQENETGLSSFNGTIDTDNAGYTGAGFINTPNAKGQGITYQICIPVTGTYNLSWRYAHGKTDARPAQIMVDGTVIVPALAFPTTGTWTTWAMTAGTSINLTAGTRLIRLQSTAAAGLANIDRIEVTGSNPQPGSCGNPPVNYTLTTSVSGSGSISPASGTTYVSGSVVTVTATASSGYKFIGWSGALTGTTNPASLTMDANKSVIATFTEITGPNYTLTTAVIGSGTVSPANGSAYASGTVISVSANPASGWKFDSWSGGLSGSANPASLTMSANKSITATFTEVTTPPAGELFGWAAVAGSGLTTTTGGGNATPITVTSLSQLNSEASGSTPKVIHVSGQYSGTLKVGSNKTIIGLPGAKISSSGSVLQIGSSSNVIIRNIHFQSSPDGSADMANISGGHHIWIDHCNLVNGGDGLLDITGKSDFITISWNKIWYTAKTGHQNAMLIASSNSSTEGRGKLNITFHHNWWAENITERQPRVRFGKVHILNNLYEATPGWTYYAIRCGFEANVRSENNVYKDFSGTSSAVNNAATLVFNYFDGSPSSVLQSFGDLFINCTASAKDDNGVLGGTFSKGNCFTPPYQFPKDPTTNLEVAIKAGAGARMLQIKSATEDAITNNLADFSVSLYPNPVNDLLNLSFNKSLSEGAVIQLLDISGHLILNNQTVGNSHTIDMSDIPSGLYIITVTYLNETIINRISKQ